MTSPDPSALGQRFQRHKAEPSEGPKGPYEGPRYLFIDSAGIRWSVNRETGHALRLTPPPSRPAGRRPPKMEKYFSPSMPPNASPAPSSVDVLVGYLIATRPRNALDATAALAEQFHGAARDARDAAVRAYVDGHRRHALSIS